MAARKKSARKRARNIGNTGQRGTGKDYKPPARKVKPPLPKPSESARKMTEKYMGEAIRAMTGSAVSQYEANRLMKGLEKPFKMPK